MSKKSPPKKRLNHPHIVQLHDVFEDDGYIYLIMEICTGGEVFDVIQDGKSFSLFVPINQIISQTSIIFINYLAKNQKNFPL